MRWWLSFRLVADRVVAAVLLVLVSPLILGLMVVVRLHDGGPALIAVARVGRHGRRIRMWKLRSMRAEAPGGVARGISLTSAEDDRITPVGRRMRAWYLDELPQLWNVVRGEMCLLGARPEAPEYVDLDDPRWVAVLAVPPGIAGATQLIVNHWEREVISATADGSGYVEEVLPVKLAIDEWYLDRSSPRVDAMVLGALLRRFLPRAGNQVLKTRVTAEVPEVQAVVAHIDRSHPVALVG